MVFIIMNKQILNHFIIVHCIVSVILLINGCNQQPSPSTAATKAPPATQVTTLKVIEQDIPVNFEYVGQVAGSREVEVRARITGIVKKYLFQEGKAVTAGDILFKIEPEPFLAQVAQAEAALASAIASKASARAELKKAQRDIARISPLTKKNLLSRSEQDNAESAVELATAAVQRADAAILQARASIKTAQINLNYTEVKAPISGIIGRALKTEGSLAEVGNNSLLATIAQINPAYVNFGIAETEQIQHEHDILIKKLLVPDSGYQVMLKTTSGRALKTVGQIDFRDYKINISTGNFAMRAVIDNSLQILSPGQFVRVILQGAKRPAAIALPQRAVLDSPQGKYVYVAEKNGQANMIAQRRSVEVGEWVTLQGVLKNAWIITSGLKQGDEVVINGMARIFYPGMPIQIASDTDPQED